MLQASRGTGQTVGASTGAINGTVTDSTGAILPGATIVASSDAVIGNDGKRTTVANGDGLYREPARFFEVPVEGPLPEGLNYVR